MSVLRDRRKDLGLTQLQMAALIGVKPPMVSKVEDGKVRPESKLDKWAKHYQYTQERFQTIVAWAVELPLFELCARLRREEEKQESGFIDCTRKEARTA